MLSLGINGYNLFNFNANHVLCDKIEYNVIKNKYFYAGKNILLLINLFVFKNLL